MSKTKVLEPGPMLPGAVLGTYRIVELIGEGGMGYVYRAEHTTLGRKVALKTLHVEYSSHEEYVSRFFAEARAANEIENENIIEVTDLLRDEPSGTAYFVMELLKGRDLRNEIDAVGALPLDRCLGIAVQVTAALRAAHDVGIVHRDLKPENIFLTERAGQKDFVKILDFGVAKLVEGRPTKAPGEKVHRTAPGVLLGTPEYASPEQATGRPVDYRADIYSLGVILYEMVTGRLPFQADHPGELLVLHATEDPRRPTKLSGPIQAIPADLEELIMQCLEKDPDRRPQSMTEVRERLAGMASERSWVPATLDEPPPRPSRRGLWLTAGAAALLLAGVGAFFAFGPFARDGGAGSAEAAPGSTPQAKLQLPARVSIAFSSTPSGAEVFVSGQSTPIGVTPFEQGFELADRLERFEVRKEGYSTVTRETRLTEDASIEVALEAAAAVAPASDAGAAPSGDASALEPLPEASPRRAGAPGGRGDDHPRRGSPGKRPPRAGPDGSEEGGATTPPSVHDRSGVIDPFE